MQLFYSNLIEGNFAKLVDDELQHCAKTLRKKAGDSIQFTDGMGFFYEARLVEITKKHALLEIIERKEQPLAWDFSIHIAIAPTKNMDRLEWFLEKAIEVGINEFTPLLCRHSERKQLRIDRLEKIAHAACKQSLKASFPVINELVDFQTFVKANQAKQSFIAHCQEGEKTALKTAFKAAQGSQVLVLIGPEGDFSPEEVDFALEKGFQAVSLGESRLRTETAGLIAAHTLHLMA